MDRKIELIVPGGVENLRVSRCAPEHPKAGELRIRHEGIGVNFIDVYQRTGLYPLPMQQKAEIGEICHAEMSISPPLRGGGCCRIDRNEGRLSLWSSDRDRHPVATDPEIIGRLQEPPFTRRNDTELIPIEG